MFFNKIREYIQSKRIEKIFSRFSGLNSGDLLNKENAVSAKEMPVIVIKIKRLSTLYPKQHHPYLNMVINSYIEVINEIVHRYNGDMFNFSNGEALLFIDVYNESEYEENVKDAVKMALQIVNVIGKEKIFEGLSVSAAVSAGEVLLGDFGGENRLCYTGTGKAVETAYELVNLKEENSVLCDEKTGDIIAKDEKLLYPKIMQKINFKENSIIYEII